MRNAIRPVVRYISCNRSTLILAVVWSAGLLTGSILADGASQPFLLLTRSAAAAPVSVVGLCTITFLPFLLTALAVFLHRPRLLYGICFCKALLFSWSGCCIMASFGSAGWLVRLLYQFSDLLLVPVLCWFSLRHISGKHDLRLREGAGVLMIAMVVGSIDYWLVAPFLVKLIH